MGVFEDIRRDLCSFPEKFFLILHVLQNEKWERPVHLSVQS
jgi:hypothetical protein